MQNWARVHRVGGLGEGGYAGLRRASYRIRRTSWCSDSTWPRSAWISTRRSPIEIASVRPEPIDRGGFVENLPVRGGWVQGGLRSGVGQGQEIPHATHACVALHAVVARKIRRAPRLYLPGRREEPRQADGRSLGRDRGHHRLGARPRSRLVARSRSTPPRRQGRQHGGGGGVVHRPQSIVSVSGASAQTTLLSLMTVARSGPRRAAGRAPGGPRACSPRRARAAGRCPARPAGPARAARSPRSSCRARSWRCPDADDDLDTVVSGRVHHLGTRQTLGQSDRQP